MQKNVKSWLMVLILTFSVLASTFICSAEEYDEDDNENAYEIEIEISQKGVSPVGVNGKISILDSISGEPYETASPNQVMPKVTGVEAIVENKTFAGVIGDNNFFTVSFGDDTFSYDTSVQIKATISDGQVVTKTVTIKNIKIALSVSPVYYTENYVRGTTIPKATVSVFIGNSNKEYKKKANSDGSFAIKIPKQKIGTEIFVGVVSPELFNNSKTIYVTQPKTTISVNYMFHGGTKVKGYVTNVSKGDYLLIKSNGVSKKIKIQKNQKKYTFNTSVSKYKTNQKIVASLYTKKGQKRVSVTSKVFLANKIKINMTKSQVLSTDYGKPDDVYTSSIGNSSYEDWYYYNTHGYEIVIVSIYNGKVCQITTHK
jgi:hypothetical protein